ncbi:MAG: ABC transporter ATP-binding protein [Gammaproteobacteria bacterium]|nr:ABC transporter ATP-binding protein [Gammaproteobacteria bacterium]
MKLLEINSLNVSVTGKELVRNLNLVVNDNEYWGVLGGNGVGKTTLLYTIMGLRKKQAGSIHVCGKDIKELSPKSLSKVMGILFQDSQDAFPVTVMETAMAGRYPHLKPWSMYSQQDIQIVEDALKIVEMEDMHYRYVNTLSGGERRRVSIARIIVQSPKIWLLDEPTNHLDMHYQVMMLKRVKQQVDKLNGSMIMVLHDVNLLTRYCTHAVLMIGPDEILIGKVEDIIKSKNIEALYHHPVREFSENGETLFYPE